MRRSARLKSWSIAQHPDRGTWSVSHGHRVLYDGLGSRHAALKVMAQAHSPGEKVFETEDDGYQVDITAHLVRRRIVSGRPSQATRTAEKKPRPTRTADGRVQMSFVSAFGARRPATPDPGTRKR